MIPVPDELKAKAPEISFHWVTETGGSTELSSNLPVQATDSFETCPTLDIVLLGAYRTGFVPSASELAFVAASYETCTAFITICAGMIPAQLAGVLAGKTATAPRPIVPELKNHDPRTTWVENKRVVRDGKLWTSGALLNGQDLMREFLRTYWPELAERPVRVGGVPDRAVEYDSSDRLFA
ncbi:hypothetical protein E8E13_000614 [Curvularia kusanoi]|uniref:DJ-1/PfpI domain-containing protein n=1 Tax=Curvularia kusanoi TaxID=90978 RepID=A0A9P4W6F5_CURKU|nr:hypothetical protein E8E13_000614 [Curvularia kusanoi]